MIERKFVAQNIKEFEIKEFVAKELGKVGLSNVKLQNTPLGEKIIITASRPGLVVGRAGSNISRLTTALKERFSLENPQIEIEELKETSSVAAVIAEMIASTLERHGSQRFKGIGHKYMTEVMNAGALGVEILLSGKIPSSRAKTWRFYSGYLKKCGDLAITGVDTSYSSAKLKTGIVGIQVRIMPSTTKLPDRVELLKEPVEIVEEVKDESAGEEKSKKPKGEKRPEPKKGERRGKRKADAGKKKGGGEK